MKKINMKILIITSLVCLSPILLGLGFYNELPENVAIHFDINNNPNNYFPKLVFIFVMPLIMLLLQLICCITTDLSNKNIEANKKVTTIFKWIIPTLSIIIYVITVLKLRIFTKKEFEMMPAGNKIIRILEKLKIY